MKIIHELYAPEIAMIPIGDHYTMGPREAAYACNLLKPKTVIPMHFGTFPPLVGRPSDLKKLVPDVEIREMKPGRNNYLDLMEDGRSRPSPAVRKGNALAKAKTKTTTTAITSIAAKPDWQMSGILAESVEEYLYSILPPRDEVLAEMEAEAAKRKIPIVGPAVGRILHQLALTTGAKTVFEMGSAIGYSTIWWARAVGQGGLVFYTDGDRKNADQARGYFETGWSRVTNQLATGDALELLSEHKQEFDIIFNDVDKEDYPRVFRLAVPRLRKGGLFVTDNVLWSGKVAQKNPDHTTKAIIEFNRLLYNSPDLFTTILPIRDGVAVAVKK